MRFSTATSPHVPPVNETGQVMRQVIYALLPAIAAEVWYFGWGILINVTLATLFALSFEALALRLRKRPVLPVLNDYSAVVTALLLGMALPPLAAWWVTATAVFFAIIIAKHLYGGLGYNPFNPAMVGYVVVLISFPRELTAWLPPEMLAETRLGLFDTLAYILGGHLPDGLTLDALTMATPLDSVKTQLGMNQTLHEIHDSPLFGTFGGRGWEWVGNWVALGGLWLVYRRIVPWQVPVGMLGALLFCALPFYLIDPDTYPSPMFHLFSGGAMLGAFFIATDPVSGATTPRGRLLFGIGVGVLVYVIRTWGGYPDGVAFAVLLMNMTAPTLDYYTRPRVYGEDG